MRRLAPLTQAIACVVASALFAFVVYMYADLASVNLVELLQ